MASNADLLREAAALMRQRAQAATAGPWYVDVLGSAYVGNRADGRTHGLYDIVHASGDELDDLVPESARRKTADAEHMASWHPQVALAVANWLNTCARICDGDAQHGVKLASTHGAIEVARAYLGRDGG